jgi:hypothetical protein
MALGALSLPSVSTGFSSDSKSILPVSIRGISDKVEMILGVDSMEMILMDVRDAIFKTSLATLKSFTNLQETMITGFTMLSNSLMNIGNIAAKDLELEETQTNIAVENEKDEDKDESLSDDNEGKGLLTNSFKGGIKSVLKKLTPQGLIQSLIALGIGLTLLIANFDEIGKFIGNTVKFFDKEILPRIKVTFANIVKVITNLFDGLFGEDGFFPTIFNSIDDIKTAIESGNAIAAIDALVGMLVKGTIALISTTVTVVLGIIKTALNLVDPDMDLSGLNELIRLFRGLPKQLNDELKEDAKEIRKVTEEEGQFAGLLVAFRNTYDTYVGLALNGLSNIFAIALKPFLSDKTYNSMIAADFRVGSIKSAIAISFKRLGDVLNRMENAISIFVNDTIETVNKFLPKALQIDYRMPVKGIEGQNVYVNDKGMTVPIETELKDINILGKKDDKPIDEVMRDQILGDGMYNGKKFSFEKEELSNAELDELMNNKDNNMSLKTKELKDVASVSKSDSSTSIVVPNFITDNKKIDNSSNSSQSVTVTDQRVESLDSSSNALLAYFRQ